MLPASMLILLLEAEELSQYKVTYNPTNRQLSKYPTTTGNVFLFIISIEAA